MDTNQGTREIDRGRVDVLFDECKGCGFCIAACPVHVLGISGKINRFGYYPAVYVGSGCTACGICFYVCPEPGGITVYKRCESRN